MSENSSSENNPHQTDESQPNALRVLYPLILIGFSLAIVGFFLAWGVYFSSGKIPGVVVGEYTIRYRHTGRTAGNYGYTTLGLAITGCLVTIISLFKLWQPLVTVWLIRLISGFGIFLLTLIMRSDPESIKVFRYVSTALKEGDYTLGYPAGPGLAIIGFILTIAVSFLVIPKRKTEEKSG